MPIIRNPFRKQDENARPNVQVNGSEKDHSAKPIDIKEPTEYKLSGESAHRFASLCIALRREHAGLRGARPLTGSQKSMIAVSSCQYESLESRSGGYTLTTNTAVTTRAQSILVNQVQQLHELVQSPQRAQRERTLQHLEGIIRFLQKIICTPMRSLTFFNAWLTTS